MAFKVKIRYYLELLKPEAMRFLGSTENKISNDKHGENLSYLEITEVVSVHCNFFNNDDQSVFYTSVPNKQFGGLLEILPTKSIFIKIFILELLCIKVWFADQNSQQLKNRRYNKSNFSK